MHIRCIAAPIRDHAGGVNASLSITAPMVRMTVTRFAAIAPHSDRGHANFAGSGIPTASNSSLRRKNTGEATLAKTV